MGIAEEVTLYLISPPDGEAADFSSALETAFAEAPKRLIGGVLVRVEPYDAVRAEAFVKAVQPLCAALGVALLLADDVPLAARLGADGVHLTRFNGKLKEVREQLGNDAVIGVSCYGSRDHALTFGEAGADYVSFGPFYPQDAKDAAGPDLLSWWQEYLTLPVVAVGGVRAENAGELVRAGADMLGVCAVNWRREGAISAFHQAITEALQTA